MRVGLFIPCHVDQLRPRVGLATVALLERFGVEVVFPREQTCCGQPMFTVGAQSEAADLARRHVDLFAGFDAVVAPSGSCVAMVRAHYGQVLEDDAGVDAVAARTFELCEFLHDRLGVREIGGEFTARVGLHQSCHGLRDLGLASCSERPGDAVDRARALLSSVSGVTFVEPERGDECCGFGGAFSVVEEAVSCAMGRSRVADHVGLDAEVITSVDVSCLLHMEGVARRDGVGVRFLHVAEILAGEGDG